MAFGLVLGWNLKTEGSGKMPEIPELVLRRAIDRRAVHAAKAVCDHGLVVVEENPLRPVLKQDHGQDRN